MLTTVDLFYEHIFVKPTVGWGPALVIVHIYSKTRVVLPPTLDISDISWYDDVMTWKRFRVAVPLWGNPLCEGAPVDSSHKGPVRRTFAVSLMSALRKCSPNTRVAGDLRYHEVHVTSLWCHQSFYKQFVSRSNEWFTLTTIPRNLKNVHNLCVFNSPPAPTPPPPPGQNGHNFADDIFRCIFMNERFCILSKFNWSLFPRIQLKITQHWFINQLSQTINYWRRIGDKPLSETMWLLTAMCR